MTRENLLELLASMELHVKYYCDAGPHRGHMRIVFDGYVTPDRVAELQKAIYAHKQS